MKGKVVFITGSSLGIGRETAFRFAKEGCRIVVTYFRDKTEANRVANKCLLLGAEQTLVVELNLMSNKSIKNCLSKVISMFEEIDILINNAGVIALKPLEDQMIEDIEAQVRTNLEGLIKITKSCLPYVKEAIVNVASGAGKSSFPGLSVYCATKFGVRGFTQSLAQEHTNIRVLCVNPGSTATRMTGFTGTPPESVAQIIFEAAVGSRKADSKYDVDVWEAI